MIKPTTANEAIAATVAAHPPIYDLYARRSVRTSDGYLIGTGKLLDISPSGAVRRAILDRVKTKNPRR